MNIKAVIQLLRPQQWIKNGFVFLPLFFNGQLRDINGISACLITFVSFSLAASSIYCFNDIHDREADRQHPEKRQRPVASGAISISTAYTVMLICLILFVLSLFLFDDNVRYGVLGFVGSYYLLNLAYTILLKRLPIVDVTMIAIGFVLRIFAGGYATNTPITEWIVIMTFLLALFLAFAKRRGDAVIFQNTGIKLRANAGNYSVNFVNQIMTVIAAIIIVAYIMYTISPEVTTRFHCRYVYVTAVFVLAGIIRYLQIAFVDSQDRDPTKILLRDRFIQICISGWLITFLVIIYS